ncbi:Cytochrome b6-f complex iron-sulfur subunit [Caulifigura coniformis]|uniref:Cytochrome b6-f complex iron-sulfur subunit n=1 Tax=Caulifigura coniformis TaxID=2527983 RepID=A0A517SKT2_9PLAN|nr:ubiquinol-cytochrome c reductase iron-sulfur subunit [Caulifigura coniformis]QDT56724.1 Cytochrome b6-f complex iron-sulfur subunit [Caulifigura coniformis]
MTEPKKLTTAEILALARQKKAAESEAAPAPVETPAAPTESTPAEPAAAAEAPAAPSEKPKPKSTADILAAARAAKAPAAGGEAAKPKSTSDILAAARAAGGSAGAAKPTSTADILAAARAGKAVSGAAAQPAAAKAAGPAAAKAAVPAEIASLPAGEKPSVEQMMKAVRAGKPAEAVKPKLPVKAPPAGAKPAKGESRRSFFDSLLSPFYLGFGILAAWGGLSGLAMARFMMPNTVLELPSRFKVGSTGDYPLGTVSEKYKASRGVWIVHTDSYDGRNILYALSSVCTHLGCTPNWLDAEQKFKCPCHGSGFYINGINFEGPAPRPLERVGLRVAEDGQLEVDKSVKFQEELGQWSDEKSFVQIV